MNASSSMPQIPCELLHPILKHLKGDNASLCAVSLCSSTFRQEAQSILFRNVTTLTKDSGAHLKFLRTIAASPTRLALLVRAYKVSISGIHPQLFTAMGDGLQAMHNLKRLGIHKRYPRHRGRESAASVLLECTFNLESFDWTSHPSDAQGIVETFLTRQDNLKHLGLRYTALDSSSTSLQKLQPKMCPYLCSLKGTWDMIKVLLPGHQIKTLELLNGSVPTPNATDMSALVPALKHIEALSYQSSYSRLRDLVVVLQHCTSMTVLELEKVDENEVLEMVYKLPALRTLILSQGYWINLLERDIVHLIFDTCSMNLQRIEILNSPETYARYSRSQDTAQKVSKSEVRKVWRH